MLRMMCTPPYDTRTAIRTVEYGVRHAECGRGGVCLAPKGDHALSCHPWDVGGMTPVPHGGPSCRRLCAHLATVLNFEMAIRAIRDSDVFVPYGRSAHPSTEKEACVTHNTSCPIAALAAEDGVHTTERHPIRTVEHGVGSAESGCGGVCVPPEGDQAVSCHPWGLGHCPQCPMAALDAEDGVHTTERPPNRNSNRRIRCRERRKWLWWCVCAPSR